MLCLFLQDHNVVIHLVQFDLVNEQIQLYFFLIIKIVYENLKVPFALFELKPAQDIGFEDTLEVRIDFADDILNWYLVVFVDYDEQ